MKKYNTLVEDIKELSISEKEELHQLLEKYLIEARRDEIDSNYKKAKKEKLAKPTSSIKELKSRLL